tara:strand:+ start:1686 stop:2495 length:810 start_codon:yes stop_codon:yes gene_type:complete
MLPKGSFATLANGFQFHYHDGGQGDVVLFLHGSGTGASGFTNFKKNIDFFQRNGFRTIVPDLPGYGFSDKPEDEIYTISFFNNLLLELLDHLNILNCSVVGNSLGGALAMGLSLEQPERFSKLILMAPGGLEDFSAYQEMPGIKKLLGDFLGGEMNQEKIEGLLKLFPYDPSFVTKDIIEDRMEILPLMNQQVLASMDIPNLSEKLKNNQTPVLAFWGSNDLFIPASGINKILDLYTNSQVVTFSNCGHWVMIEKTKEFNQYSLNFLKN